MPAIDTHRISANRAAGADNDPRLAGHVVVITGASGGMGQHLAATAAHAGAHVVLLGHNQTALASTTNQLIHKGHQAFAYTCDITREHELATTFSDIANNLGAIDSVISNAGRAYNLPVEAWRQVLDVNLTGAFLTARAAHPHIAASGRGRLTFTRSVIARRPRPGLSAYAASKAGLEGLARGLAADRAVDGIPRQHPHFRLPRQRARTRPPHRPSPLLPSYRPHAPARPRTPPDLAEILLLLAGHGSPTSQAKLYRRRLVLYTVIPNCYSAIRERDVSRQPHAAKP